MSVTEVNLTYLLLFPWQGQGNVGILAVCTEKLGTDECYAVESNQ